jgi:sugar phosphate isomerase/epimerase
MKLAFSTNAFARHPLTEAIAAIASLGYAGVEIMADRPHAWPASLTSRELRQIRETIERHGLKISNINAFTMHAVGDTWNPSWIDPDPRRREIRIEHTRQALALAEALGSPHLSTEPGGPLPPGMAAEEGLSLFRQGLEAVEEDARSRGVRILIEPEPGLLIENSNEFAAFADGLDTEIFGLNFDAGHFYCVGEDPAESFRRLRHSVAHVHLEDIAADREHRHLIPGRGALPLRRFLGALAEDRYEGFTTIELYPYLDEPEQAAAEAITYVRRLMNHEEKDRELPD